MEASEGFLVSLYKNQGGKEINCHIEKIRAV